MKLHISFLLDLIGIRFALSLPDPIKIAPILIKQPMTWPMAQTYCRENHLDLFTITSPSDQEKLIKEFETKNVVDPAWIGLYIDLENWYFSYNHLPLENITLRSWGSGYPKNANGENVCGAQLDDGTWVNYPCHLEGAFLCYDENNSPANRFVGYGSPPGTWHKGQAYCRQYHTDLATPTSTEDISMLTQILNSLSWTGGWFGLTRDTWKWSDGDMPSFLPWLTGQPDNLNLYENCGATQSGQLVDEQCTDELYFVCSDYLFRKHVMKLHGKSNSSFHDPALQSSILELINQKLQELGMNTTVTWRVRSDGTVFYKKPKGNKPKKAEQNCFLED